MALLPPQVNTDADHLSALRAESVPFRIQEFVNQNGLKLLNETIVKSIKQESVLKKMPPRYTDSIKAEFVSGEFWIWVDFEGKKGEPLGEYFEEGTKRHKIEPRRKKALAWVQGGIQRFSKGHYVSGIKARHVFRDGLEKGYPEFKKRLKEELEKYMQETMLFGR